MAKNVKNIGTRNQNGGKTAIGAMDPDDLKSFVRDGLVVMTISEREAFIKALETEMRAAGLSMSSYLIPLGIPARTLEELTPTEVGHLVRYLKINVAHAVPAVERALARNGGLAAKTGASGTRLAA
ncbi:MAG TPA: hypothetical protein VGV87_18805 [Blastocatellia bacterium]|jgi:hypothetical protein|nr:hypothetical protein [Blastocatellia bacterium]